MHLWHELSVGKNAPSEVNVVIEIPKGSHNKYEIDKETGLINLDRVFFGAAGYPLDYGFVPQTLWEDGDAVDAMVITTYPLFSGCVVAVRVVGVIHMIDNGESDDKVLCVPVKDPRFAEVKDLKDLNQHTLREVQDFLQTYKNLEGKKVEITGMDGVKVAQGVIEKGRKMYQAKFAK